MKSIIIILVAACLFAGCYEKPVNPDVVTARVRLFSSNAIVNVKIDTTLHSVGDTLTFLYDRAYGSSWEVSNVPLKDGQTGWTMHRRGIVERWLVKKTKQAAAK